MIYVVASIELNPGTRAQYLEAFATIADEVRAKPGCIEYVATVDAPTGLDWQQPTGPDRVTIVEKWASVEALQAHNESDHMKSFRPRLRGFVRGRTISILSPA